MALSAVGLQTHIWNNNARSAALLCLYPFIMGGMVWLIAGIVGFFIHYRPEDPDSDWDATAAAKALGPATEIANGFVFQYWPAIFIAVVLWFMVSWFFHADMMRMLSHARRVNRLMEPELYNALENLCISRGMAVPRLEVIETTACNAFASGLTQDDFTVTVTRGLLESLQKDELEAVLAHELTHIANRDVRLLVVTIIFTSMLGFAAQMVWEVFRHARFGGGNRDGNKAAAALLLIGLVLAAGYAVSVLTRYAISRRREFLADAGSVEMTKNPDALMRALLKISRNDHIPASDDIAMMCVSSSHKFMGLFATHPPIERRLQAISEMTGAPVPVLPPPAAAQARQGGNGETDKNPWD